MKKKKTAISLQLGTNKTKEIRNGEITNYLTRLFSYHYKLEAINSIAKELKDNVDPRTIFVLNESFKFDHAYRILTDFNIDNPQIYSLLNIGLPTTILPNETIFRLRNSYVFLNKVYDFLKSKSIYRREWFWKNYESFLKGNFEKTLLSYCDDKIIKNSRDINSLRKLSNEIIKLYNLNSPIYSLNKKEILSLDNKKYLKEFSRLINVLHRPVVGTFNKKDNSIKIINKDLIRKGKVSSVFIDLKSLSHQSPWDILLVGTGELFKYFVESESRRLGSELKIKRISLAQKEEILKDLQIIRECMSTLESINSSSLLPHSAKDSLNDAIKFQLSMTSEDIQRRALTLGSSGKINIKRIESVSYLV